jgi:LPS-assembly lipoprotein
MKLLLRSVISASLLVFCFCLIGCGFHLRGQFTLPKELTFLKIANSDKADPFQRILKRTLKSNGVQILPLDAAIPTSIFTITEQTFTERNIAYGSDVQVNRVLLQFNLKYQISNHQGRELHPYGTIVVERELTVNPNAILGTEDERGRVHTELYTDASVQLIRQLSVLQGLD